VRQDGAGRGNR